jgi:hypothetical protein
MDPTLAIGGMATAIGSQAAFIAYLVKYVLADKDKQIAEWKEIALSALSTAETIATPAAGSPVKLTGRRNAGG